MTNTKTQEKAVEVKAVETQAVKIDDKVMEIFNKLCGGEDKNINLKTVTGYTGFRYGNKVLCEIHLKKRSISHITFGSKQSIYSALKQEKLIREVKPSTYGWILDTECLFSKELLKALPKLLEQLIKEEQAKATKKEAKKEKKVAA